MFSLFSPDIGLFFPASCSVEVVSSSISTSGMCRVCWIGPGKAGEMGEKVANATVCEHSYVNGWVKGHRSRYFARCGTAHQPDSCVPSGRQRCRSLRPFAHVVWLSRRKDAVSAVARASNARVSCGTRSYVWRPAPLACWRGVSFTCLYTS